jgi:hypothetical protein
MKRIIAVRLVVGGLLEWVAHAKDTQEAQSVRAA